MLTILSVICLGALIVYFTHTFGSVFYGNIWEVIFFAIAVPLMFLQSKNKFFRWVGKANSRYFKAGRILSLVCMYLILVICTTYIPDQLRTFSTSKYVKPAIEKVEQLRPVDRVIVVSYGKQNAAAIVLRKDSGKRQRFFVWLTRKNKDWTVAGTEEIAAGRYTFPPYH